MYILTQSKYLVGPVRCFVSKTGPGRKFRRLALTALLVLGAAANAAAQPLVQQVLVLQSFDRGSLPVDHFSLATGVEIHVN